MLPNAACIAAAGKFEGLASKSKVPKPLPSPQFGVHFPEHVGGLIGAVWDTKYRTLDHIKSNMLAADCAYGGNYIFRPPRYLV
jgi:hypothetical protein